MYSVKKFILGAIIAVSVVVSVPTANAQKNEAGQITLDFEGVELRDLIRFIAEATGKNFIVDNRVAGKATVISPQPVSTDEALAIFENLLAGSGYAIVPAGKVNRIVPMAEAGKSPIDILSKNSNGKVRPGQFVTRLVRLRHVSVNSVLPILKPLLSAQATISGYGPKNTLVVTENYSNITKLIKLVKELDTENDSKSNSLDIVYLKNGNAEEVAKVLTNMIEGATTDDDNKSTGALEALAAFRSNVSVVADKSTNAVVISAEPDDMRLVKSLVERLDIRRLQVYVEALIMEVSAEISDQFGVEWRSAANINETSGFVPFGGTNLSGNINNLAQNPLSLPSGFSFGVSGGTIEFGGQEFANIGFLVNALKSDSNVNILSTPQLLTLDNQEAEIVVGDNIPFVTGQYTPSGSGDSNPFQTIERKDIGLTLKLTPQISENGFIRLNIYQEISSINTSVTASDLITRKRSIRTTVVVPDNNMVILGGLIRDDVTEVDQQVPCLANLFGVGQMFKNNSSKNNKTNLMVFIKPTIVNAHGTMDKVTKEKYQQMRELQIEQKPVGTPFVPDRKQGESSIIPDNMRYTEEDYLNEHGYLPFESEDDREEREEREMRKAKELEESKANAVPQNVYGSVTESRFNGFVTNSPRRRAAPVVAHKQDVSFVSVGD